MMREKPDGEKIWAGRVKLAPDATEEIPGELHYHSTQGIELHLQIYENSLTDHPYESYPIITGIA